MRSVLVSAFVLSCLALTAQESHAEIMVGGFGTPAGSSHPLSQFSSLAQGTMTPARQILGPATQLHEPYFGTYEPNQQLIYVSDFRGQAIRVFPAFASGDVAPLRVINPPQMGQTRANAPAPAHNELGVIVYNCCIATYPLDASGDAVFRIREVRWGGGEGSLSGLNNPFALIYLPASDEYAVLDQDWAPPHAIRIVFHHRTSDGNVLPSRVITGAHVAHAVGMAHDPVARRIFVLQRVFPEPGITLGVINVFDDMASGDAAPLHTITSNQLQLQDSRYFVGLGFDPYTQRLMISSTQSNVPSNNRIVTLSANAIGETSPIQVLDGTHLSQSTVGVPFGVPSVAPPQTPLLAIAQPTALPYGQTSALSSHGGQGSGAVSFTVTNGQDVCLVNGSTLTAIGTGACTVTATKEAVFGVPEQTASVNLDIAQTMQAPLTLSATPTTLPVGGTSVLSTEGGSGTGAVQFQISDGFSVCTIQGNTLVAQAAGTCGVRAIKWGDVHYHIVSSQEVTITVVAGNEVFADDFETSATQH